MSELDLECGECEEEVPEDHMYTLTLGKLSFKFCSKECRRDFMKNPNYEPPWNR